MSTIPELADYVVTYLNGGALAFSDVFYGDQNNIPRTPTACVDTGVKRNELNGAPRRTRSTIELYVLLYHYKVASTATNQRGADQLAADTEAWLHADPTLSGLCIHSLVTTNESGYATRSRDLYRVSRLTLEITQQEQLPSSI